MYQSSKALAVQPQNGVMKTYDNPSRTFTRPYSAKTVYFFKEGDSYFSGIRVPVSHHRYKNLHMLMDELNRSMFLPYGVRNISTSMGRTAIHDIGELEHLGRYIASSSKPPKGVNWEKLSANSRREQPRVTAGGQSYWMPTSPTPGRSNIILPNPFRHSIPSKQIFFVLNGKGKFFRANINPNKKTTMDMLLEECSENLKVAIHRLYTPEGKLFTTMEEVLAFNGPKIIACPRNERPHLDEQSINSKVKLPEINPSRYAPRVVYQRIERSSSFRRGSADASGSSSGNSMEKIRQPLPTLAQRYIPRKHRMENGLTNGTTSVVTAPKPKPNYISQATAATRSAKKIGPIISATNALNRKAPTKEVVKRPIKNDDSIVSSAGSVTQKDSGTGTSIHSQQSDRPASMTDKKAQMIREELQAAKLHNQHNQSSSEQYSEEDMIQEEESDFENIGGGIHSGTDDEEEDSVRVSRNSTHRTPAHQTPSTSGSGSEKRSRKSTTESLRQRTRTMSRQDTPYQATPSRQSTAGTSSSRASTASKAIQEASDEEEEEEEELKLGTGDLEDDEDTRSRGTLAAETPDSRLPSRASTRSVSAGSSIAFSRVSNCSDKELILPSDDEDDEREHKAAVKVTRFMRRYAAAKQRVRFEEEKERERQLSTVYSIEILLGERYSLDFDTQLFIVIHGEEESSKRINIGKTDWLSAPINYYEPQQWIIERVTIPRLGILKSIDFGHDEKGYGAGTFIDRVVITELEIERSFEFHIAKWFDSGQVDGLIQRHIPLRGYMHHIQNEDTPPKACSKGRWEFRLFSEESELGGTTSNMIITVFGQNGSICNRIENKNLLVEPIASVIQLDLGADIGELRKIRFELEKFGEKPDYFLDRVVAIDLDTRKYCVIMVNGWLRTDPPPGGEYWQPFREIAMMWKNHFTSSVKTYNGTVVFGDCSLIVQNSLMLQYIHADDGDDDTRGESSGRFPIVPVIKANGETEFSFNVDFVTQNNNMTIRIIPELSSLGKDILDGFEMLQESMDYTFGEEVMKKIWIGNRMFVDSISTYFGDHVPYYITYGGSSIIPDSKVQKHLIPTGYPSKPTRNPASKAEELDETRMANWELSMTLDNRRAGHPIIPTVVLVARDRRTFEMECVMEKPEPFVDGWYLKYTLTCPNFGNPRKCRLSCEETSIDTYTNMNKIFLTEKNTNTQVFIKGEVEEIRNADEQDSMEGYETKLEGFETQEYECPYPDDCGQKMLDYRITVRTQGGGGEFRPYINVIGTLGDTGYRAFPANKPFLVKELYAWAIDLGELQSVEVWAKTGNPDAWKGFIQVLQSDEKLFESKIVELTKNGQIAQSALMEVPAEEVDHDEEDEDEEEGEYEY